MRWFSVVLMAVVVVPVGAATAVVSSALFFIVATCCRARRRDFHSRLVALRRAGPSMRLVCMGKLSRTRLLVIFPGGPF